MIVKITSIATEESMHKFNYKIYTIIFFFLLTPEKYFHPFNNNILGYRALSNSGTVLERSFVVLGELMNKISGL